MTCKNCKNRCDCKERKAFERLLSLGDADCSGYEPDTMPDKLTDKKYSRTYNPCDDCLHSFTKNNQESGVCEICEFKQSLDLINRQKAEIERLREIRDLCNDTILKQGVQIYKLNISDASKEECTIRQHNEIKELRAELKTAKAEAYKECVEKVKDEKFKTSVDAYTDAYILGEDDLDNLLKELGDDSNA